MANKVHAQVRTSREFTRSAKMLQLQSLLIRNMKMLARYFICLFYFNNIKEFQEQKERLISAEKQLQKDVDDAKDRERETKKEVEQWLGKAAQVLKEVSALERNIQGNKRLSSRLNWSLRCRLSDEIEDLKQQIFLLVRNSHIDQAVFRFNTLWENEFFSSSKDFMPSKHLKAPFFEVLKAISDEVDLRVIVVRGPQGIGKGKLAEVVEKQAKEMLSFKVVHLVASQSINAEEIQEALAAFLGFTYFSRIREENRAKHLRHKLIECKEKILIILDYFWEELNLESIGIPCDNGRCKVLVTTSNMQAFSSIRTYKVIEVLGLEKEEARKFLQRYASGESYIQKLAEQIADECKHSPFAATILGRALKEKPVDEWKEAYQSLKSKLVEGVSENNRINYISVNFNYDHLKDDETRKCFLLCSLFPKGYPIALEAVKRYSWGLGIYPHIDSVENVGKKVDEAIKNLKKSCLLLQEGNSHVRMRDVIHDAALWIASKDESFRIKSLVGSWERPNNNESYTAISYVASKCQEELNDEEFISENLQILFLNGRDICKKISNAFLQGLGALQVLAIHNCDLSLDALQNLTNMQTLHLEYCKLDGLESVAKLKKLEILSFQGSDISALPDKIEKLDKLRLLDLFDCQQLEGIPLTLIQKLYRLEELYLSGRSFEKWLSEDTISVSKITPQKIIFPSSLKAELNVEYQKTVDERASATSRFLKVSMFLQNRSKEWKQTVEYLDRDQIFCYENQVVLNLVRSVRRLKVKSCTQEVFKDGHIHSGDEESDSLLLDLTSLELEELPQLGSISWITNPASLQNLNTLILKQCHSLQSLFSVSTLAGSLKQLQTLEVHSCDKLKHIIAAKFRSGYLPRLKALFITGCHALEYICQTRQGQILPMLTLLEIGNCPGLKHVFSFKGAIGEEDMEIPQLKQLALEDLTSLKAFCSGSCRIKLTSLQHLRVGACHDLSKASIIEAIRHHQLKSFSLFGIENLLFEEIFNIEGGRLLSCLEELTIKDLNKLLVVWKEPTQIVPLQNLTCLKVVKCNKLTKVFSQVLARNLLQLRSLVVQECEELEEMVYQGKISLSPTSRHRPVYFPNLEEILIEECDKMKSLFPVSFAHLPKLKTFSVIGGRASKLVHIFRHEDEARGKGAVNENTEGRLGIAKSGREIIKQLQFPKLEKLHLIKLSSLQTFNPVDYCCKFPVLSSLKVIQCHLLRTKFEASESDPTIYAKTKESMNENNLRRAVTYEEIPIHNGDINWPIQKQLAS